MRESDDFNEFKQSVMQLTKELKVEPKNVSFYDFTTRAQEFSYLASGGNESFYFEYYAKKSKGEKDIDIVINISESSPPDDKMVTFREKVPGFSFLERYTGAAMHYYNINMHPVDLKNMVGEVPLYVLSVPNYETKPQIEVLLNGIPLGQGNELEVYKFRHVDKTMDYYRFLSYLFKFHTSWGTVFIAFPWLGGPDSGGASRDLEFTDECIKRVKDRKGIVIISELDIEYAKFENFVSLRGSSIADHMTPELELNQLRLPLFTAFGKDFQREWRKFLAKFYARDLRGALGDIRPLVQDALRITCEEKKVDISKIKDDDPNSLVGLLIGQKMMDGRFQAWTGTFTAFANIGNHSKVTPTEAEFDDIVFRKRVVMAIMLGIQLIEELQKILKPESYY
jgi:hypothetical protein